MFVIGICPLWVDASEYGFAQINWAIPRIGYSYQHPPACKWRVFGRADMRIHGTDMCLFRPSLYSQPEPS